MNYGEIHHHLHRTTHKVHLALMCRRALAGLPLTPHKIMLFKASCNPGIFQEGTMQVFFIRKLSPVNTAGFAFIIIGLSSGAYQENKVEGVSVGSFS